MTGKTEVDGFWTGPVWREIETFACGMAGVPPPSRHNQGASKGAPDLHSLADDPGSHDGLLGAWNAGVPRDSATFAGNPSPVNKRYGLLPVGSTYYRDAEEVEEDAA